MALSNEYDVEPLPPFASSLSIDVTVGPQSVLQGNHWQLFQDALGRSTHRFQGEGWIGLVIETPGRFGPHWYLPYGPLVDDVPQLDLAVSTLVEAARRERIKWLRMEPIVGAARTSATGIQTPAHLPSIATRLHRNRIVEAPCDIQPRRSRWIDTRLSQEDILAGMTGTDRTLWRQHGKKGLEISATQRPEDIETLIDLNCASAERSGFTPHDADYLRQAAQTLMPAGGATLYMAHHEQQPVCAVLVYDSPTTRIFAHAGMKDGVRKLRPNQPMIVQAILDAAGRGQQVADLFGIAPSDSPAHPWAGFTAFKRSFGGYDVDLSGTWDIPVSSGHYRAYRSMRSARDTMIALFPAPR